ncbi:hypothetical protein [Kitasatospora sp. NPDC093679]|uniref:hypothetical protein n=1 Tax=Kitasatospora sp. NPDC093679 TaxID=3154983 RepID=UPI0034300DD7
MYWIVTAALGCAGFIGWRMWSYPGGWDRAFDSTYADERQELADARRVVRQIQWAARREISTAQAKVHTRKLAYDQRVRAANRRLERLRTPGYGEALAELGETKLHEHVLVFAGETIPLAGLRVRFEQSGTKSHLYLDLPNTGVRHEMYPHKDHPEDDVRAFAVRAQNAAVDENAFLGHQKHLIAEAEAELAAAKADTAPHEEARQHLTQVTQQHRKNTRLGNALADLDAVRDRWHQESGRRPR